MKPITQKIKELLSENIYDNKSCSHGPQIFCPSCCELELIKYCGRLESIVRSAGELAEALEFYSWRPPIIFDGDFEQTKALYEKMDRQKNDGGKRAIEALEKFTKTIEGE